MKDALHGHDSGNSVQERLHRRVPVKIKIEDWPNRNLRGHKIYSHNLSLGGIMIEVIPPISGEFEIKKGDSIDVGFLLPGHTEYMQVSSQIVWIKYSEKNHECENATFIGAKFIVMTDDLESTIRDFIDKNNQS